MIKKATLYVRYFYANTLHQKKVPPLSLRSVRVVKVHTLFIRTKLRNLKSYPNARAKFCHYVTTFLLTSFILFFSNQRTRSNSLVC